MDIRPRSNWVRVFLRNLSAGEIEIPAHTVVAQVQDASAVPHMLASEVEKRAEPS